MNPTVRRILLLIENMKETRFKGREQREANESDSEISKADKIQSAVEEGYETTTARKKETDVPVDQTPPQQTSKQDATSEDVRLPGMLKKKALLL